LCLQQKLPRDVSERRHGNKEENRLLIDAISLPSSSELECDLCVIGAGAAGIAIADRLRGIDLRVVLLEAGGRDYELASQALYRGRIVGDDYYRIDACRWRMFGGSTNRWGGWCRPLDPIDYAQRDWLPLSGWPIGSAELAPYEGAAAALCELPNARFDLDAWRDRLPPPLVLDNTSFQNVVIQHSPETNFAERHGPRVVAAANVTTILHANVTELHLEESGHAVRAVEAATLSGKRLRVRPRAVILAAGGIENARLLLASCKARPAGIGNESDMVGRCFMEHLHLPAGHFIPAPPDANTAFYRKAVLPGANLSGAARSEAKLRGVIVPTEEAQSRHRLLAASIGFEPPSFSLGTPFLGWLPSSMYLPVWAYRRLKDHGLPRAAEALKQGAHLLYSVRNRVRSGRLSRKALELAASPSGSIYSLYVRAEQAPDPMNRVRLDEDRRDALGMPRARLEWRMHPIDIASVNGWLALLRQDLHERGAGEVILPSNDWRDGVIGGPHHMGTTRMSSDPRRGVVDADCRVHTVDNLYVAGSSVFATSGHANPTFTLLCLALRLADTLRRRLETPR
jgi:choline dehydrogenase-like flavoprotein